MLPGLVAGQALGILLADRDVAGPGSAIAIAAIAILLFAGARGARVVATAAVLLALAGGVAGQAWRLGEAHRDRPLARAEKTIEASVRWASRTPRGTRLELEAVRDVEPSAVGAPRRMLLWLPPEAQTGDFQPGMRLRARVRITTPRTLRNPGQRRDARRIARRGIGAVAQLVHPTLIVRVSHAGGEGLAAFHGFRRSVGERLSAVGEGGALLRALALGDAADLDASLREGFARLGVAHLLAVSGLHLALVTGAVYAMTRRLLRRSARLAAVRDVRDVARVVALLAAFAYAALSGFGTPVRRALVLVVALVASAARARRSAAFQPLVLAALIVLAWEPASLFAPGAQLSFAACAALLFAARGRHSGTPPGGVVLRSANASAVATAATAPLAAWHWGTAAPLAVVVNLLAIPWTAFVLLPSAFAAVAAAVSGDSTLAQGVLIAADWIAGGTLEVGRVLSAWLPPGSGALARGWVWVAAGTIAVVAIRVRQPLARIVLATLLGVGLWCAPPAPLHPGAPRLVVLDVGRGDGLLVQGSSGAILVDAAAAVPERFDLGASVVVPALRALGVRRLDLIVATHADLDHRGGIPAVLKALPVGELWLPFGSGADAGFDTVRSAAMRAGVVLRERGRGSAPARFGDLRVSPLWPPGQRDDSGVGQPIDGLAAQAPRNERSLVVRVDAGRHRVLLLGDLGAAEPALLASGHDLRADVLVLPHHGSRGSSSRALLEAVGPRIAIVSAPCPAQRSLPHEAALARARRANASLWWSGRDGAVFVGLGERLVAVPFAPARDCRP